MKRYFKNLLTFSLTLFLFIVLSQITFAIDIEDYKDAWYYDALVFADENHLLDNYDEFNPDDMLTTTRLIETLNILGKFPENIEVYIESESLSRIDLLTILYDVYRIQDENFDTIYYHFSDTNSKIANDFYLMGVITGIKANNDVYYFKPKEPATTIQLFSILEKINEYQQKPSSVLIQIQDPKEILPISFNTRFDFKYDSHGLTPEDKLEALIQLAYKNQATIWFDAQETTKEELQNFTDEMAELISPFHEYLGVASNVSIKNMDFFGECFNIVWVTPAEGGNPISEDRNKLFTNVYDLLKMLEESGIISVYNTESENAYNLAIYICNNVRYDYNLSTESHYGAKFFDEENSLVCDGYTTLYNAMLRLLGIEAYQISGIVSNVDAHAWTIAKIDNEWIQIDVTFMDNADGVINPTYFNMSQDLINSRIINTKGFELLGISFD